VVAFQGSLDKPAFLNDLIARLLDKAGFALDDLYALGIKIGKQENIAELAETGRLDALLSGLDDAQLEELFEKLLTFGKLKQPLQDYTQALIALEGKHGAALTDGILRLAGALEDPYATMKALEAVAGLPKEVVEQAQGVLVSAEFLRAVQRQQDVLPILVQALQNYGKDGALLFRQAAGSTEEYVTLVEAIKLLARSSDDTGDWVRHLNNILGKGVLDKRYVIPGLAVWQAYSDPAPTADSHRSPGVPADARSR
jgi:hypothetical protein